MSPLSSHLIIKKLHDELDMSDAKSIERYAAHLEGMTFEDVLALGIEPENYNPKNYGDKQYKGGMGNLIEERYFGYAANSDEEPDFKEAGVELKATPIDMKKNGDPSAGERLVLTMIPYDRPIAGDFFDSHLWKKCKLILLVFYNRDKNVGSYDQQITHVKMFTPPKEDLRIIAEDYNTIVSYIQSGRADELSEGLTTYLGAATKGATAASSWVPQYYPFIDENGKVVHRQAKKRAFSFKRQYMDYVLHRYVLGEASELEKILAPGSLEHETFEQHITNLINSFVGMSDQELAAHFNMPYTGNKAQWNQLVFRILGIKGNQAEEFVKAGITVKTVRIEENGRIKENVSLPPFKFKELAQETWETSRLREYFEETRFFFVAFKKYDGKYQLAGSVFWNMPVSDIEGDLKRCWAEAQSTIRSGVEILPETRGTGVRYMNNLPGESRNPISHVRPHASQAAYRFLDGTEVGSPDKNANELPDGRWMTTQSFWLNREYIQSILCDFL